MVYRSLLMVNLRFIATLVVCTFVAFSAKAQTLVDTLSKPSPRDVLRATIAGIAKDAKGTIGFAMLGIENRDTLSYNGSQHLPMQSVMKFPIAVTVFHEIDEGKFTLNQLIHIDKNDLPKTYSPLRDKFPEGNVDVSIKTLLSYMVSLSDNDACDILLKILGGPGVVDTYMHSFGVKNISVKASEFEMAQAWDVQFTNWTTAQQMIRLLDICTKSRLLCKPSHDYLWQLLEATSTGPNQIKGLLPAGTIVAHKTGHSSTNEQGITAAMNDVGIITLPNGKHLAIAVFVNNSFADTPTIELTIARLAKAAYDMEANK